MLDGGSLRKRNPGEPRGVATPGLAAAGWVEQDEGQERTHGPVDFNRAPPQSEVDLLVVALSEGVLSASRAN